MGVIEALKKTTEMAKLAVMEKVEKDEKEKEFRLKIDCVINKCASLGYINIQGDCEIVDNNSLSAAISTSLSEHIFETAVNTADLSNDLYYSILNRACRMPWIQNKQTETEEFEQTLSIFSSFLDTQIEVQKIASTQK